MDGFWAIVIAAFGAVVGSFLNVVALRYISGEDIVKKRSHCAHCGRQLAWFELIPVVSYVALRGRCRTCHAVISLQYPIVEVITAIAAVQLLAPVMQIPGQLIPSILMFIIACLIIVLGVIDAKTMFLPDVWVIAVAGVTILHLLLRPQFLSTSILGAVAGGVFLLLLWILTRGKGIGLGDVKLGAVLGLIVGWPAMIGLLLIAFGAGGLVGVYLLVTKQATRKTAVPFGPYLALAALAVMCWPSLSFNLLYVLGWPY